FSERDSPDRLAHYLEQIFCRHPWADEELTSLVYEDERGRVAGFLGIIPRPLRFQGEPVRAAVATQLMVAPERRGLVGRRLMRTFLTGPQDLSLSDTANEVGRRLWESLGGSVSLIHSLAWTRTLRPCRHLAGRFLYYCHTGGGLGEVLQLAARRSTQTLVLRHLWRDAWRRGLTAIAGRVEPAFVDELAAHGSRFGRDGPWMLIHSPRVELLQ